MKKNQPWWGITSLILGILSLLVFSLGVVFRELSLVVPLGLFTASVILLTISHSIEKRNIYTKLSLSLMIAILIAVAVIAWGVFTLRAALDRGILF
ncbi:MAG: hypothetical protein AAB870_00440 [Patescibacteria group bacterium]